MSDDIEGLVEFGKDIFSLASVSLRAEEIINARIKTICDKTNRPLELADVVYDAERCFVIVLGEEMAVDVFERRRQDSIDARAEMVLFEKENREKLIRDEFCAEELIHDADMTSSEKVNNIETPRSVADRVAVMNCLRKGVAPESANMFVDIKRRASVQVGAHLIRIYKTCLRGVVIDADVE